MRRSCAAAIVAVAAFAGTAGATPTDEEAQQVWHAWAGLAGVDRDIVPVIASHACSESSSCGGPCTSLLARVAGRKFEQSPPTDEESRACPELDAWATHISQHGACDATARKGAMSLIFPSSPR